MIPYLRYLHCLFLKNNDSREKIVPELSKYGLPTKESVLDLAYDRFLQKLESRSSNFSSCLSIDLYDEEMLECAKTLGISQYLDDSFRLKSDSYKIVRDPLVKKHVECCLLTRVPMETIVSDIMTVYRVDISIADIVTFNVLFFDESEVADTNNFVKYISTIDSVDEKNIKNKCRANGAEYSRWALGVPVNIDVKQMAKDMIADAYFRYKEAYTERAPDSVDKALKLGNLVTKLIDREVKLSATTSDEEKKENTAKEAFGEQLCLFDFKDEKSPTVAELTSENNTSSDK